MVGFVWFHTESLLSLFSWIGEGLRGPSGWYHIHLFVLGWATMLAMGAVYQLINVILQTSIYSERLGYLHYAFFTVGLLGLLSGFKAANVLWIAGFATLALTGILLFAWNMAVTLWRAGVWNAVTISAACAVLYLVLTGLSGFAMGLNFAFGGWPQLHNQLFGAHIWVGTIGWFGLLITGFSYKMAPMFYLAHHYPARLQTVTLLIWNAAVLAGAFSFLFDGAAWSKNLALLLLGAALTAYNIHLRQIRKHRHKRSPGTGIHWTMVGNTALLVFVLAMAVYSLSLPEQLLQAKSVLLAGWIYLVGWVSFTILGYASKIVPFLWWTYKYGKHVGKPGTPVMSGLLNDKQVNVGMAVIACTTLLLLAGLSFESQMLIAAAGMAYSLFSLAYIALLGLVFSR
jgi:hypothetical protein